MADPIVRLTAAESGASAEVAVGLGFNCFRWLAPFAGDADTTPRELLWAEPGFELGDKSPSRSGTPLLAPFPGRIAGGVFEWEGARYELEKTGGEHAIHGFAVREAWRVLEQSADAVTAEFRPSLDAPDALSQWPTDYRLRGTYRVEASRLVLDFSAENLGDRSMPFGFGTHAYFRLPLADGADPESTSVHAPVDAEWLTNALIPSGEITPIGEQDALPTGAELAGREFDTPFRFTAGATSTTVADPATRRAIVQTFDTSMRCCVIYTPEHREAICLEPYTCVPDPLALQSKGIDTGLMTLEPGQTYATRVVLEAKRLDS